MTRKDYVKLAAIIRGNWRAAAMSAESRKDIDLTMLSIALDLADMLAADNLNFDRASFLVVCGVEG